MSQLAQSRRKMRKKMEKKMNKFFEFEVRAENSKEHGNYITGRPIVFEAPTDMGGYFQEIIDRNALANTDLRDVRFLVGHNSSMIPLARSRRNNANSTMQMEIDVQGMAIRVDLDTENNSDARALHSATKRGDISGMSFAFIVDGEVWENMDTDYPTRRITSIAKVLEVSAVAFPQYEQTSLEARAAEALENAKASLEKEKTKARCEALRTEIRGLITGGNKNAD